MGGKGWNGEDWGEGLGWVCSSVAWDYLLDFQVDGFLLDNEV